LGKVGEKEMIWIILGAIKGAVIALVLFNWLMDGIDDDIQLICIAGLGVVIGATWQFWLDTLLSVLVIVGVIASIVITFLCLETVRSKLSI